NSNRLMEALELGKEALAMLGFPMPHKASRITILKETVKLKMKLRGREIEDFVDYKELNDPVKLAISRILMHSLTTSYIGVSEYFLIVVLKFLNLCLTWGNSPSGAFAYISYGIFLCSSFKDIDLGFRMGTVSLQLIDKFNSLKIKPKVYHMFGTYINHWKNHIGDDNKYLLESYTCAPEAGDIIYGLYSINQYIYHCIFLGIPLDEERTKFTAYYEIIKKSGQHDVIMLYQMHYQLLVDLSGDTEKNLENRLRIKGTEFDEEVMVPRWLEAGQLILVTVHIVCKLFLCCLYGAFEKAIEVALEMKKLPGRDLVGIFIPMYYFYFSLAMLSCYRRVDRKTQRKYLKQVKFNRKKIELCAHHAPMNHLHRYYLVEAELERVRARTDENRAMKLYEQAIREARKNGFTHEEALANELAAQYHFSRNYKKIAELYLSNAYTCYARWGIPGKLKQLEEEYPELIQRTPRAKKKGASTVIDTVASTSTSSGTISEALDLSTVIKASQALSGEIVLSKLLSRLMRLSIENAGAEKGYMILERNGKLLVEAEGAVGTEEIAVLKAVPLEEH
ncbi:MAG: hypothetical protein GY754_05610, partial [bacterium]|nr:hypothetical protein [bacterium]